MAKHDWHAIAVFKVNAADCWEAYNAQMRGVPVPLDNEKLVEPIVTGCMVCSRALTLPEQIDEDCPGEDES